MKYFTKLIRKRKMNNSKTKKHTAAMKIGIND